MVLTGYLLSGLIAVGIVFIGSRFLWDLPPHHVTSASPILHRRRPALPDGWL